MSKLSDRLRQAVQRTHACIAEHVESVPVVEMVGDKITWEGMVDVFDITGHAKARRCYGWSYLDENNELQFTTVLGMPPVLSAETAVKAAIAAHSKSSQC